MQVQRLETLLSKSIAYSEFLANKIKKEGEGGAVVHKKTATALALTGIKNEDKMEFSQLVEAIKGSYNDKFDKTMRTWGGGIMGVKSQAKTAARQRVIDKELKQREAI